MKINTWLSMCIITLLGTSKAADFQLRETIQNSKDNSNIDTNNTSAEIVNNPTCFVPRGTFDASCEYIDLSICNTGCEYDEDVCKFTVDCMPSNPKQSPIRNIVYFSPGEYIKGAQNINGNITAACNALNTIPRVSHLECRQVEMLYRNQKDAQKTSTCKSSSSEQVVSGVVQGILVAGLAYIL